MANLNNVLKENLQEYFLNEFTTVRDFRRLNEEDQMQNFAQYALAEYVNTSNIVDALFNGKEDEVFGKLGNTVKNTSYMKDITTSNGDITKTMYHKKIVELMDYARVTNSASSVKNDKTAKFDEYASTIMVCIRHFEVNKDKLKKLINNEAVVANNKGIALAFYRSSVALLQITADVLYSNSIKAKFDTTFGEGKATVSSIYFEYDTNVVDEMMETINYLNGAFANGKIFKAFDPTLQENFIDSSEKIALNEGIIDTVFGLVTHFKTMDLLILWPLYITRSIVYWIGYMYATFKNITLDIDESIAMKKANAVTRDKFNQYQDRALSNGVKVQQAFRKADVTVSMNAKEDKKILTQMQSSSSSVLI